jgi:hypothetical protein
MKFNQSNSSSSRAVVSWITSKKGKLACHINKVKQKERREDQTLVKERATWSEIKKQNENENCQ